MFGPRLTRIFASRWHALWWGASILLLAWQLVPAPDDEDAQPAPAAASAGNPWALSTAASTSAAGSGDAPGGPSADPR